MRLAPCTTASQRIWMESAQERHHDGVEQIDDTDNPQPPGECRDRVGLLRLRREVGLRRAQVPGNSGSVRRRLPVAAEIADAIAGADNVIGDSPAPAAS